MVASACPPKNSGGQQEEGHRVVHHVQWEHHQSYLLNHNQNASIQYRQIQLRMDKMQMADKILHFKKLCLKCILGHSEPFW